MAAVVKERLKVLSGDWHESTVHYVVTDAQSEDDALDATWNAAVRWYPISRAANYAQRNENRWKWSVQFEEVRQDDTSRAANPGTSTYYTSVTYRHRAVCPITNFDFGTESETVYEGLEAPRKFARTPGDEIDADYPGINYENNGNITIKGTDKLFPSARVSILWQPEPRYLTTSNPQFPIDKNYLRWCQQCVGKVNSHVFLDTFNEGEVLMTGFSGRIIDQRLQAYELNFQFGFQLNQDALTIDGIDLGAVRGWEYVWGIRDETQGTAGTSPVAITKYNEMRVERLYDTVDFNTMFCHPDTGVNWVANCPLYSQMRLKPDGETHEDWPFASSVPPPWTPTP